MWDKIKTKTNSNRIHFLNTELERVCKRLRTTAKREIWISMGSGRQVVFETSKSGEASLLKLQLLKENKREVSLFLEEVQGSAIWIGIWNRWVAASHILVSSSFVLQIKC